MMARMTERQTETFGQRVERLRKARGLSQVQLAAETGLSQTTISDIERGRNKGSTEIVKLAAALGVSSEELISGTPTLQEPAASPYRIDPKTRDRLLHAFDLLPPTQKIDHLQKIEADAKEIERHIDSKIRSMTPRPLQEKRLPSKRLHQPSGSRKSK